MLDRFFGYVHDTEHGAPLLRSYLWWGILVRSALLMALATLLLVEGNVLAEWLLKARVPLVSQEDVEELSAVSYSLLFLLLTVGTWARWQLLHRLDVAEKPAPSANPLPPEETRASEE